MISSIGHQSLLETKLHRPRVTADVVQRPRLKKALDQGLDRPLILVAAPAGFGKSTLVSAWLEQAAMFTVALDKHGEWYRYHHLFRDLLRDQLARQVDVAPDYTGQILQAFGEFTPAASHPKPMGQKGHNLVHHALSTPFFRTFLPRHSRARGNPSGVLAVRNRHSRARGNPSGVFAVRNHHSRSRRGRNDGRMVPSYILNTTFWG